MAENQNGGAGGGKKGGIERERGVFWKRDGMKTPPLFFLEITDYLTHINNLCPPEEMAGGGGGGRGFIEFVARGVR